MKPFSQEVKEIALWLREFVWDLYPDTNELIYDNYNAVSFGWSLSDRQGDVFSTVAVFRTNENIHFGFYWGSHLADPKKILLGQGNQYRYILVKNKNDFPKTYIKRLLKEAFAYSLSRMKDPEQRVKGATLTKMTAVKKRPATRKSKKK